VGDPLERPDFLAAAFSETAPLEFEVFFAWVFPPLVSLVDWGMCFSFEVGPDRSGHAFQGRGPRGGGV
jgi:hypothetical protein